MFKVKDIKKTFKQDFWSKPFTALDIESFEVNEGEIVGFLGANGAGKTTLLKIMMGFISANSGEVTFSKKLGTKRKDIFQKIGFLPERPYFYPYLKGIDFIKYMASLSDMNKSETIKRAYLLAEEFKIDHALEREIRGYSKGMLQRLGFVSTLIHNPELIILDEPLSGLDPIGRKEIKDHLCQLNKKGKTVFFSSHIVSDVEEICKKTIVLDKGKVAYQGSIDSLIAKNTSDLYEVTYLTDKKYVIEIEGQKKDKFLSELISKNAVILELKKSKATLEQVIYHI